MKEKSDKNYTDREISKAASEMGKRGMKALMEKMTPEERSEKARKAVQERWRKARENRLNGTQKRRKRK